MNVKKSIGFTLLEIIIAMLILSLVTAGIFGLFVTSSKYVVEAGHRLQAINYARQVAETLKLYVSASNTAPALANSGTGAGCALENGDDRDPNARINITNPSTIGGIVYTVDRDNVVADPNGYSIVDVNDAGGVPTGLKQATIRVRWTEQ